jgi:signal peptidase I
MSNDPERPWDAWEDPAAQPADEPAPVDPSTLDVQPEAMSDVQPDAMSYGEEPPPDPNVPLPPSSFPSTEFAVPPTHDPARRAPAGPDLSPSGDAALVPSSAGAGRTAAPGFALWKDEIIAWCRTLISAAVYATLIVTFGFQVARVEGQSMAPTLADQDRLIVNKLAYRFGPPRRGDIVMLYYPRDPEKSFVKRVIAEEGDTIKIENGQVYVNNVPMADDYVPEEYRSHDSWGPEAVREGYYFVMGDHRNNSSDSRHWGEVPKKYIIGRVQMRWWPIPTARLF